jgi:hypothetical protein
MGRTACTEPRCLYKGDLYLYLFYLEGINFLDSKDQIQNDFDYVLCACMYETSREACAVFSQHSVVFEH